MGDCTELGDKNLNFLETLNSVNPLDAPRVFFSPDLGHLAHSWYEKRHKTFGDVHEPGTIKAFMAVKKDRDIKEIWDVGAHNGYFTLLAAGLFPDAKLTAIEAHPALIKSLARNVPNSVSVVHCAISDISRGDVKIWFSGINIFEEPEGGWDKLDTIPGAMKNRGRTPDGRQKGRGFVTATFITLDKLCEQFTPPDLIKIDVEAHQGKAVLGGKPLFEYHHPVVIIELHDPEKLDRMETTNAKTVQPLFDVGYECYWCGDHRSMDGKFEKLDKLEKEHEKLSIAVFV